jgi:CubicO group peptidase (beta-lactamase class C family)
MARFGYLMLQDGQWDGTQVVPQAWVEEATGHSSQPLNAAYGYLWWLNRKGKIPSIVSPTSAEDEAGKPDGQMVPGAPDNVFWALGLGNQMIAIFPDTGVVAVRLGPTSEPKGAPKFETKAITLGTQEALVKP